MLQKNILISLIILLITINCSLATAAVHVSGAGQIIVNRVETLSTVDVSGNTKLRIILNLSGPYISEYESVADQMGSELSVNFDNLALANNIEHAVKLDGKVADSINFNESLDLLKIDVKSGHNRFGDAVVTVVPKSKTAPYRIIIDLPLMVVSQSANITSGLKGKKIVLDPGHGGSDTGAIGPSGITEKAVNISIALKLRALLINAGAQVIMTRDKDIDCSYPNSSDNEELSARVAYATRYSPDIFISLHNDAFYNRDSNGTGTYYFVKSNQDARLAKNIQRDLQQSIGLKDRGIRKANFFVLRNTKMPAALVEVAFISNVNEEKLLTEAVFQQKAAKGIFDGINDYFSGR